MLADKHVTAKTKKALTGLYKTLNPAQVRRDLLVLQDQFLVVVRTKHQPSRLPAKPPPTTRAESDEATKRARP